MRPRFVLLLALLLSACGSSSADHPQAPDAGQEAAPPDAAADAVPDAPKPTKASFKVEDTFTIASTSSGHLAFPDLARLADGRIMLVYRQGASHVDPSGRIMKQFGTADGKTWTAPAVLYDAPGIDDRDPSVATLSNGDVIVDYFQYKTVSTADGTMAVHHIFTGRSTDNGKSFGPFVQADSGSMSPSNPHLDSTGIWVDGQNQPLFVRACSSPIIEMGGQLVLPAYGGHPLNLADLAASPKSRISLFVSSDGQTWTEQPVLTNQATSSWLEEPVLLQLADGTTLMQIRTALGSSPSNAGKLMQSSLSPGAKSWSAPISLPFVAHAPNLIQLDGTLVLSAYRLLNDAYTTESVAFSWSLDDGGKWSDPIQVVDCHAVECGYPSMVGLGAGRFLLVYYAPGGTAIKGVIYDYSLS